MTESKINLYSLPSGKLTMNMLKHVPSSFKFVGLFGDGKLEDAHEKNKEGKWESVRTGAIMSSHNFTDEKLIEYINSIWGTPFFNHCALIFAKDKYEFSKATDAIMSGKFNKVNMIPLVTLVSLQGRKTSTKRNTTRKSTKRA